jgi:putative NADH-flavin reductase
MHLALFGASGRTGLLLTKLALAQGHTVSALVRNPKTYAPAGQVKVIQGDAFTPAAIARTLEGADAVFSALGARSLGKEDVLERAVPLIVHEMEQARIPRFITLGSAGALDSALDKQPRWRAWLVENLVYQTALKWPVASQRAQYAALAASPLNWTMVMPPMLLDIPLKKRVRVDGDALPPGAAMIARADVADFMMQQLTSNQWSKRGVYISW